MERKRRARVNPPPQGICPVWPPGPRAAVAPSPAATPCPPPAAGRPARHRHWPAGAARSCPCRGGGPSAARALSHPSRRVVGPWSSPWPAAPPSSPATPATRVYFCKIRHLPAAERGAKSSAAAGVWGRVVGGCGVCVGVQVGRPEGYNAPTGGGTLPSSRRHCTEQARRKTETSVSPMLAFSLSLPLWEETLFPRKTFRSTVPVLVPALVEYVILFLPISGFAYPHTFKPTWGLSHKKTPLPTRSAGPRWPAAPRSGAPPHGSVPPLRRSAPHSRVPVAYGSGELACLRALFWRGWFCPGVCCGL